MKYLGAVNIVGFLHAAQQGEPRIPRFYLKVADIDYQDRKIETDNGEVVEFVSNQITLPDEIDLAITKIEFNEDQDERGARLTYHLENYSLGLDDDPVIVQGLFLEYGGHEYSVPQSPSNLLLTGGDSLRVNYSIDGRL